MCENGLAIRLEQIEDSEGREEEFGLGSEARVFHDN